MKFNNIKIQLVPVILLLISVSCHYDSGDKNNNKLPRSKAETEGVDSKGIIDFLRAIENSDHEFHSFMFLRHGKVVAEGWWSPYSADLKHTLYSLSKSFTSTAVGFAVTENLIKVTDKVVSFFPESLPDSVSSNLADMEVRDLLCMAAGQDPDPTTIITSEEAGWVQAFLDLPVLNDPGSRFLYNSMATYMLSAIVQKVTGDKIIDYLTPRLFEPLGIEGMDWEVDPEGINTGGWGLRLKTEDMAKFGQLYLQKGSWNGKQIITEIWVNEATTFKIDQLPGAPDSIKSKSDWLQGYCYQFWRCRNNAFRGDGAFGQYVIVIPEKDAVVAITCETPDMQSEIDLVWDYLLPSIKDHPLPENPESAGELVQMLSSLALRIPEKGTRSVPGSVISGKAYNIDPNSWNVESMTFNIDGNDCLLKMKIKGKDYDLHFGRDSWSKGTTTRPGPNLLVNARGHLAGIPPEQVAGIWRSRNDTTLELTLRYIESPHTETLTCTFTGSRLSVQRKISYLPGSGTPYLTGKMNL
jgi:CubicO group peptidase (beta-lactamase class C family)